MKQTTNNFLLLLAVCLLGLLVTSSMGKDVTEPSEFAKSIHPSIGLNQRAANQAALEAQIDVAAYHNGATLYCSQCHVMHASEQHNLDSAASPDPGGAYPRAFTANPKLLKAGDPVAVCLMCHDGMVGVPDVVGADVNNSTERAAGFFGAVGANNDHGHKIAYGVPSLDDRNEPCNRCHFVGEMATAAVSCIDCHNPHGNNHARNLQWASAVGYEDQFSYFIRPGTTGLARYERDNIGYGTLNSWTAREVTSMCWDCHHNFSGESNVDPDHDNIHSRHPSYTSESASTNNISQGAVRGSSDPTHWSAGTGAGFLSTPRLRYVTSGANDFTACRTVDPTKNGVFCLSCHKAHGSDYAFGMLWTYAKPAGEGCDQCHNKTGL